MTVSRTVEGRIKMSVQDEVAIANRRLWEEEVKKGCGFTIPWLDIDVSLLRRFAEGKLAFLPEPMTEWELTGHLSGLSSAMAAPPDYRVFAGAGSYEHYIPQVVSFLISRSEFVTSYTP